jgi:hypothetical protein
MLFAAGVVIAEYAAGVVVSAEYFAGASIARQLKGRMLEMDDAAFEADGDGVGPIIRFQFG